MKRIRGIIALICCFANMSVPCLAETSPPNFEITATSDIVKQEEEVYVLVNLQDNTGFGAMQFCITYDQDKLLLESTTMGEIIPEDAITSTNTDITGEINFSVISIQDIAESGTVLVSKFKAKEDGEANIDFKLLAYADINGESLNSTSNDTKIVVKSEEDGTGDTAPPGQAPGGTPGSTGGTGSSGGSGISGGAGKNDEPEKPADQEKPVETPKTAFADVLPSHWAYSQIGKVCEMGLFSGTAEDTFSPNVPMTRAMFVTVLHRFAGTPESEKTDFADVETSWYTDAVSWAAQNGIVSGTGEGKFSPDKNITRGEIASILARYKNGKSIDINSINSFKDADKIPEWGKDSIAWAVEQGLVMGRDGGFVAFSDNATRAEAAVIFTRFLNIQ